MAISSADAGTVMDMRRTTTTATMGTGTDLASACTSVVAVTDGVVTVATLAVTIDKAKRVGFLPTLSFRNFSGERGGKCDLTSAPALGLAKTAEVGTTPTRSASR